MTTKTISLAEEAYERLAAEKREGESFSDVGKRLVGERSWTEVAGIWSDGTDEVEAAIEDGRVRSRSRRERLGDDIDDVVYGTPEE
ncbi:antitoxin VapB family protein [Halosimplex litoreum]|uniref:Antitoxin VapB family protein n=1 Tax=Halosimplex litoreum TaxID=1198301 RepID=A0A7T3G140_9EURY|nr:antitoxin VapB family protein [Halosimplex litoreum]QPV64435.1 antitoxin VapB family protein [Halosimplex litoreum]